jgi:hypothetical protein
VSGIARRCIVPLCLGLAMLGSLAPEAGAQLTGTNGAQQLPSPAVFGGARSSQPGGNSVTLTLSGGGGYDTNVVYDNAGLGGGSGADGPVLGSTSQTSSAFGGGGATLAWNSTRRRVSTFGMASANYRTFFDIDDYDVQSYDFGGGLSAQLTRQSRSRPMPASSRTISWVCLVTDWQAGARGRRWRADRRSPPTSRPPARRCCGSVDMPAMPINWDD